MAESQFWQEKHDGYAARDWSKKPSIFVEEIVEYFPAGSRILELGCGQGQDGLWLAGARGFHVIATDFEQSALDISRQRKLDQDVQNIVFESLNLDELFVYDDEKFDVVYSHLALHYFDTETTKQVFNEIYRVLKPGGIVAFLVNSVNDPEYNRGTKLEDDYFETEGTKKRYFSAESVKKFVEKFDVIICDEKGETYKDIDKGVHHLVRFVGKKPA